VLASVPVVQRECYEAPITYRQPNSGAGTLVGAVVGAAIGNSVGAGAGRAVATGIGMVTGAAIGDQVEANASPPVATTTQRCRNVTQYENRTIGYDVVYEYQGVRRSARMAQDPGDQVALEISVRPVGEQTRPRRGTALPPPLYRSSADVTYEQRPPPMVYAPPPVYAQPWPYLVIGAGWQGGWHGHRRH